MYAAQHANFEYLIYIDNKLDNKFTGEVCADLPRKLVLIPADKYQPYVVINGNRLMLIDYKLEQVTEMALEKQNLYRLLKEKTKLESVCLSEQEYKYCINFYQINNKNCSLDYKIPQQFDYIRG